MKIKIIYCNIDRMYYLYAISNKNETLIGHSLTHPNEEEAIQIFKNYIK